MELERLDLLLQFRNHLLGILYRVVAWSIGQLGLLDLGLLRAAEFGLFLRGHLFFHFALQVCYGDRVLLGRVRHCPVRLLQRGDPPFEGRDLLLVELLHLLDLLLQLLRGLRARCDGSSNSADEQQRHDLGRA